MHFTIALLQISAQGNDIAQNLAKGLAYCREVKARGADLAVFPELWSIGASCCPADLAGEREWLASAIDTQSEFLRSFAALARELRMNIAISYLQTSHTKPRNTVSILDRDGNVVLTYSKVCLCDFPAKAGNEAGCDINCSPGDSFPVCNLSGGEGDLRVGAMICADREFPEPAGELMLNGAELIVVPNACDWDEARSAGLLTRALENLFGVAMANYPRPHNNGNSRAYSCVAWQGSRPENPEIAVAGENEEVLMASFDLDEIREFRKSESWRLDHRNRLAHRKPSA